MEGRKNVGNDPKSGRPCTAKTPENVEKVARIVRQTVNQVYYKNILTTLRKHARRRRPDMWKNASWVLHHDNALSVKRYLAKNNIPVTEHPPYSPDLASCDFFLFPKIKSALKGTRFKSADAVKAKATQLLKSCPAALLPTVENSHGAV
ncbi:hypothetical protein B7P43_G17274 [Cryptotermes secundus]|uniref:Tc1-like transposase DDE domain-containing protein n=1 Tax=Cryptotermes secundus TaxID=105785 RepID=A0A2J7R081_9NEOP|nr:hypothetical protein B7P43_G17274 [Cryptotermes secundus]